MGYARPFSLAYNCSRILAGSLRAPESGTGASFRYERHKQRGADQSREIYTLCLEAKGAKLITPTTTPVFFKTAGLSDERWSNIRQECNDEAEKAVVSVGPKTSVEYNRNRLFVTCAELKGATYVGYARLPLEQWNVIQKLCTEEFEAAIAGLPESRRRGELRDERKFECIKRNGISLHDGFP